MNTREQTIARAAMRAYQAKGVARATMSDIAKQAGVSRQTVYNSFPSSDAMLHGAVICYIQDLWDQVQLLWRECDRLDAKLDVLLEQFALRPWEFLNSSPAAAELERGHNPAGRKAIVAAREIFRHDIAALFEPWQDGLHQQGTSPLALSDYISAAIEGIKYNNHTRADMESAITTLRASVLAMVQVAAKT